MLLVTHFSSRSKTKVSTEYLTSIRTKQLEDKSLVIFQTLLLDFQTPLDFPIKKILVFLFIALMNSSLKNHFRNFAEIVSKRENT